MFSTDHQRARACKALLKSVPMQDFWTDDGPTKTALDYIENNGGPLSSGERVMLLLCADLWNGSGKLSFNHILDKLDNTNLRLVGEFLVALSDIRGSLAIDEWLRRTEGVEPMAP